jgi:hypothetical protein
MYKPTRFLNKEEIVKKPVAKILDKVHGRVLPSIHLRKTRANITDFQSITLPPGNDTPDDRGRSIAT